MDKSLRMKRNMLEEFSDKIADEGRGEDDVIGHLTKGEVVIPKAFMEDPQVAKVINEIFAAYEVNINQYTVGHEENSINPKTGNPEFLFGFIKRAAGTLLGAAVGFFAGGPGGAVKGAQIGAGVDVARATADAAAKAQKESQAARAEAASQAAAATEAINRQAEAQAQQAEIARQRLEAETARFAAEKAKLEEEAKKRAEELEAAQREMGERESARLRAARRSGRRSLLSQARLSPELGLGGTGTSLSPTMQTAQMM